MDYYCSECKVSITAEEYEYSKKKYNIALCREHQKSHKKSALSNSNKKGLTKRESSYRENMVKARIAETLIEELFLSLKFNVFRYGMENTIPGIMELLKEVRGDVADNIRRMPDFVVQDPRRNRVYFIEVKFVAKETFSFNDLDEDYPYQNCYFIVVSKKHIKCITYKEFEEGRKVTPTSKNYLGNRKEFELDKKVIIDFCSFAVKFFENV